MLHAWSLLDLGFRVRKLIEQLEHHVRVQDPQPWRDYCSTWNCLRDPRNAAQHIDTRLPDLVRSGVPAWGYLTWIMRHSRRRVTAHMFASGLVRRHEYKPLLPSLEAKEVGVHDVRLHAFGAEVRLSSLAADIGRVVQATDFLEVPIPEGFDMATIASIEPIIINHGSATPPAAATSR